MRRGGYVGCSPSQTRYASGFKTSGIRSCSSAHSSFGVVVMITKLRTLSPAREPEAGDGTSPSNRYLKIDRD